MSEWSQRLERSDEPNVHLSASFRWPRLASQVVAVAASVRKVLCGEIQSSGWSFGGLHLFVCLFVCFCYLFMFVSMFGSGPCF